MSIVQRAKFCYFYNRTLPGGTWQAVLRSFAYASDPSLRANLGKYFLIWTAKSYRILDHRQLHFVFLLRVLVLFHSGVFLTPLSQMRRPAVLARLLPLKGSRKGKAAENSYGAISVPRQQLERVPEDTVDGEDDERINWPPADLEEDGVEGPDIWNLSMWYSMGTLVIVNSQSISQSL